jgi:hypothetical protein
MQQTTPDVRLPEGLALIEYDRRWFPAFAPRTTSPYFVVLTGASLIPAALEPWPDPRQGYDSREEAIQAYRTWWEEATLPLQWEHLAASTEVYPERNAWYVDEIVHLTGDTPRLYVSTYVSAVVITEHKGSVDSITATAATLDEVLAVLYEHVYPWSCDQQRHTLQWAS